MTKGKQIDKWIIVVDQEGIHPPLHAFGKLAGGYLCDQVAMVDKGRVVFTPLDQTQHVEIKDVTFDDININLLPDLAPIARRMYAAIVEHRTTLAAALSKTVPGEDALREKIRKEHDQRLVAQKVLLMSAAIKTLNPKESQHE